METSLINKILSDIKKNGYLTELNVGEKLRKRGWKIQFSQAYLDPDMNKSREIDLIAEYSTRTQKVSAANVSLNLIIESKKSVRPWIVFCSENDFQDNFEIYSISTIRNNFDYHLTDEVSKGYIRNKVTFRGRNFYEAFKDYNEQSKIYEAVIGSSKAADYFKLKERQIYERKNPDSEFKFNEPITIKFFIPLIVLEGQLVKATIDNNAEPQIEEKEYIPLVTFYHDPEGNEQTSLPDLVTLKDLETYLASLEKWINALTKRVEKGRESLWKEYMKSDKMDNS